ncbi:MAG: RimK/LysX family protein [Planctomycetota bacterium]
MSSTPTLYSLTLALSSAIRFGLALLALSTVPAAFGQEAALEDKHILGPTAEVDAVEGNLKFEARVDTGAATTSVHVDKVVVEEASPEMKENVGKRVKFRIGNHKGRREWVVKKIVDVGVVKTSERQEERYKVNLTLKWKDVKKRVLVTLNDRSRMEYALLLGRNFLEDDFLVDVGLEDDDNSAEPLKKL